MNTYEQFYERGDEKWAHPELVDSYKTLCYKLPENMTLKETVFNSEIPLQKRKEMVEKNMAEAVKSLSSSDMDRRETYYVDGFAEEIDAPQVEVQLVRPKEKEMGKRRKKYACILCIPGGGWYSCLSEMIPLGEIADELECIAVTLRYRTIFDEGDWIKTMNDCHAVYQWIISNAKELGINPDKIVLTGGSSGSQLALSLCHRLKRYNWNGYKPRGCVVFATIPDERLIYRSSLLHNYGWSCEELDASAKIFLGRKSNPAYVSQEAFPNHARVEECVGLPPTFIHTDENDSCTHPSMDYASKLNLAGVYTELHLWGGSGHGMLRSDTLTDSSYTKRFKTILMGNYRDCIQYDLRREWQEEKK